MGKENGKNVGFPEDFIWGAATSAYQIEGAVKEDGKGEHIWDVYTKEPGKVYSGHTGEVACDHYHRYKEDVQLMKEMGLKAYRFSIDWSRVLPDGFGRVNEKGIEFYNHLIDELVENKIEPYITLYHWELPYEIYKRGGWMNPQIVEWFGEYAKLVAERFSDRVSHFFTLNEPQCFVGLGFLTGEHAPGVKAPMRDTFEMAHNALKAHGRAVQMLRTYGKQKLTIGYAPTSSVCYPKTDRPEDIEAARKAYFSLQEDDSNWTWNVSWWSDPVLLGHYPEEGLERYEKYLPKITEEDMRLISEPIDIYGQNIYNGRCFRMGEDGKPQEVCRYEGFPKTAIQWPVTPECLQWGPKFLYERYHKPIYITQNGLSCHDVISLDGKVHDPNRIDFLARYLRELRKKDPFWGLFSSVNNKYLTIYKEWCRVKVSKEFHRIGCNSVHYPIRKEEVFMMKELKPIKEGKVREIYDNGDSLIMVATDRISCFDVILNNVVTKKGTVLTQMSKFWFDLTEDILPNHMISVDVKDMPEFFQQEKFDGNSMMCRKLEMLPIECIVRGYITGSGWASYQKTGKVCGIELPEGLKESDKLPEPIYTPSTKAEIGDHDENISYEQSIAHLEKYFPGKGAEYAEKLRDYTIALYKKCADYALSKGIIIADTKFEFGLDENGNIVIGDEMLTPDSSRFWPADGYEPGHGQPSFDKQFARDWLKANDGNHDWTLPQEIVDKTIEKYLQAYEMLTGKPLA